MPSASLMTASIPVNSVFAEAELAAEPLQPTSDTAITPDSMDVMKRLFIFSFLLLNPYPLFQYLYSRRKCKRLLLEKSDISIDFQTLVQS